MAFKSNLFTEHPNSVGESYLQHLVMSSGFAWRWLLAAMACSLHALFPFLCKTTGSTIIKGLHNSMIENRDRRPNDPTLGT